MNDTTFSPHRWSRRRGVVAAAATVLSAASVDACSRLGSRADADAPHPSAARDARGVESPGSALSAGLRLVYASGTVEQPPWTIDSVTHGVVVGARHGCSRIVLRTRPNQPAPEVRLMCRGGDTLFAWNATAGELRVQRPVGPRMTFELPQPNGAVVSYVTDDAGRAEVSGRSFAFVHTTVTTHDSAGRLVRRLRERYAVALGTALDGVFEVRDTTAGAARWRETQRFALTRVE